MPLSHKKYDKILSASCVSKKWRYVLSENRSKLSARKSGYHRAFQHIEIAYE